MGAATQLREVLTMARHLSDSHFCNRCPNTCAGLTPDYNAGDVLVLCPGAANQMCFHDREDYMCSTQFAPSEHRQLWCIPPVLHIYQPALPQSTKEHKGNGHSNQRYLFLATRPNLQPSQ